MFNQDQLHELLSYEANGHQVVSIYLDTDSRKASTDVIKLQLKGMLKEAQLTEEKNAEEIERFINHSYDWTKPGLALFCSRGGQFFRAIPTAVSFRNRVRVGHKPYVKPLTHLLDFYAHYGVIMIDRVGARFYEYHLGEPQATDGTIGEDVRKLKQGRGSSAVGMRGGVGGARHEEEVAQRNLREAAAAAASFFDRKAIRRLFIGGTSTTVAQFKELLPKKLLTCLAGTFAIDMNATEPEVRQHTLTLLADANAHREKKLVSDMLATYAKGGNAVVGVDDTLQAICDKKVETLIISDGYNMPGFVHEDSGYVVANLTKSPLSDRELIAVMDVIDTAVAQTLSQGGRVEVISNNPELENAGKIGAILRY
jgi:peptide chain release factor subunit 1